MLFTIVTVTRNNLQGLKTTQASIAMQSCADYEWIVIDGASTDGTEGWLTGKNAKVISEPDRNIYDAMNKGVSRARGDYLILMNAGDAFAAPDTLARIAAAIEKEALPPAFIYGDALEERPGQTAAYKRARPYKEIIRGMITHHQAMLYRTDVIGTLRFDDSYDIAADYKFTAQFLQEAEDILYLDFPLCLFEAGGVSQRRVARGRAEQFRVRQELALCGGLENARIYLAQAAIMLLRRVAPSLYWRLRGQR